MSEQRFTIQEASGMYLHLPIFDNGVEMADGDVCILLNEQQSTIQSLEEEIKLLKPTNIEQYEQIQKLQEENEQLRKELDNFKPVMFQDVRKGTVILYSKGDIDE